LAFEPRALVQKPVQIEKALRKSQGVVRVGVEHLIAVLRYPARLRGGSARVCRQRRGYNEDSHGQATGYRERRKDSGRKPGRGKGPPPPPASPSAAKWGRGLCPPTHFFSGFGAR